MFVTYTMSDIFQLRIQDVNEVFTTFRLAEMPLQLEHEFTHFVQVGSKQMRIKFTMTRNEVEFEARIDKENEALG